MFLISSPRTDLKTEVLLVPEYKSIILFNYSGTPL